MVLALPMLTRLYTPEDFSLLAIYVSILGLITVVSCLRYNFAIPLPQDDQDGMALLIVSLLIATMTSLLCALPVAFAPQASAQLLGEPGLEPYLWMIPAGVFIASTYNALQYWTTRKAHFGLIAKTRVTRAVGCVGTQLGIGTIAASPTGLIVGQMLYGGLGIWGLARNLLKSDRTDYAMISLQSAQRVAREYSHFPTRSTPAALFDAGYQFLPILIVAPVVGGAELGILFLVMRILGAPVSLVGSSISQVYLAGAGDRLRAGTLGPFTRSIMLRMISVGAPAIVGVVIFLLYLSDWIFGGDYASAGQAALWMAPWFICQLACSPVSSIFAVTNRQTSWLLLQIIGFVMIAGGTFAATRLYPEFGVPVFAISNFAFYAVVILVVWRTTYKCTDES